MPFQLRLVYTSSCRLTRDPAIAEIARPSPLGIQGPNDYSYDTPSTETTWAIVAVSYIGHDGVAAARSESRATPTKLG